MNSSWHWRLPNIAEVCKQSQGNKGTQSSDWFWVSNSNSWSKDQSLPHLLTLKFPDRLSVVPSAVVWSSLAEVYYCHSRARARGTLLHFVAVILFLGVECWIISNFHPVLVSWWGLISKPHIHHPYVVVTWKEEYFVQCWRLMEQDIVSDPLCSDKTVEYWTRVFIDRRALQYSCHKRTDLTCLCQGPDVKIINRGMLEDLVQSLYSVKSASSVSLALVYLQRNLVGCDHKFVNLFCKKWITLHVGRHVDLRVHLQSTRIVRRCQKRSVSVAQIDLTHLA